MALSLYCAASVYVSEAKDHKEQRDSANLELLTNSMAAIGRQHAISRAYLNQILLDIERNGLSTSFDFLPTVGGEKATGHGVPLVVRGSISRHSKVQPPLPGRLPLGAPQGRTTLVPGAISPVLCAGFVMTYPLPEDADAPTSKRMRTSARSDVDVSTAKNAPADIPVSSSPWSGVRAGSGAPLDGRSPAALFGYPGLSGWSYASRYATTTLPHRTGSPAMNIQATSSAAPQNVPSMPDFVMTTDEATFTQMPGLRGSGAGTGFVANSGNVNNNNNTNNINTNTNANSDMPDLDMLQSLGQWSMTDPEALYAMLFGTGANNNEEFGTSQDSMAPWEPMDSGDGGNSAGGAWDTGGGAGSG